MENHLIIPSHNLDDFYFDLIQDLINLGLIDPNTPTEYIQKIIPRLKPAAQTYHHIYQALIQNNKFQWLPGMKAFKPTDSNKGLISTRIIDHVDQIVINPPHSFEGLTPDFSDLTTQLALLYMQKNS